MTVSTTTEAQQGAAPEVPVEAGGDFRINLETEPVHLPAIFFALDGGTWSMGVLRCGPPVACGVLRIGCSAGPAGDVRTHGVRANTLQALINISVVSQWIIREYLTAVHLGGRAITKRAMLDLQK